MEEPRTDLRRTTPQPTPPVGLGPAAFEEVYLELGPRLRRIAMQKFRIPPADAETVVQDVFTTYIMQASSVRAPEPYLIGAICNASRYYWRRADATNAVFCDDVPCMATLDDPFAEEVERKDMLSRILARIDCRCRDLLHRYYMNGETFDAIASALEVKAASVPVFLHKCRRRALAAYRSLVEDR